MSKVEESIVREYFEGNRFLVKKLPKEAKTTTRKKKAEDGETHLLVFNPAFRQENRKPGFLLFASELPYIQQAVVTLRSWGSPPFTPSVIRSGAKLLRFLEQNVVKRTEASLPADEAMMAIGKPLKILILPALPIVEPYRHRSIELLQSRGVDGIISFRSMLMEIVARVEVSSNYADSDLLELIRILKNYDMITDAQMELFVGKSG